MEEIADSGCGADKFFCVQSQTQCQGVVKIESTDVSTGCRRAYLGYNQAILTVNESTHFLEKHDAGNTLESEVGQRSLICYAAL